ncbi:ATP-grasp domain-containing protein [Helicosporidium sp. ATCC 50920]|nr:ATP-grasp domain-containing protein [Helicosporidium sp. ATCC 50920]|eukprot:KDD77179.1 ATP-grasp domain-containing protein [Helicosporidium sp. ATCC 50920]
MDASAFPCVGIDKASGHDDVLRSLDDLDVDLTALPGSQATAKASGDKFVADYDLPAFNRRGGREVIPSSLVRFGTVKLMRIALLHGNPSSVASNYLTEAVIGSLPRALSLAQREQIIANTPLSPTLNQLNSLPSDKLAGRTAEGRRLRRSVLRGAVMVFITSGYSGKRFIFEKAKELGVRSVLIEGPDSWARELEREGVIERFIGIDMTESETLFDRIVEAIEGVKRDLGELDGISSFAEMAMPLVGRLAERFGLPGNPPSAIDAARDKHETRRVMEAAGLPTPRNYLIETEAQIEAASAHVGYPAVIKPIFGAASIGVVRVDSLADLRREFVAVTKELARAHVVNGGIFQGDEEDEGKREGDFKTTIMMEEYLDGPEVDVDLVMSEGQAVYGAVTDNWPTQEPYFNETGSNMPSLLPAQQQRELLDLSIKATQALGFQMGVYHVECKYTTHGARLIEVNCRMGGGPVRNINLLVWGVDMVEENLLLCAGIPSRPNIANKPLTTIAEFSVNSSTTGVLQNTDFCDEAAAMPGVLYARPLAKQGQKVVCVKDGMPTWVAELMVQGPDVAQAVDYVKSLEVILQNNIRVEPL